MKRLFALFLCIQITVSLFASQFIDEFKDPKSYIPDHIIITTGNDKFNTGISRNDDDQLSYSFGLKVESPLWYMHLDANGITNRGWRDGWDMTDYEVPCTENSSVYRGRYDSIETVFGLRLRPIEDTFYLHIYPDVGLALVGYYNWEWAQNVVHKVAKIREVDLPYDNDGARNAFMMLDGRVNAGFKFFSFSRTNLIAEVEAFTKNILGFQSENQILGRVSVSTKTHDLLGFHLGYMHSMALGDYPSDTRDLYIRYLNGFRFGFTIDTGIISLKYTATPKTNYGYGYLGVNVLGFFEPKTWKESDAYLRLSLSRLYDRNYYYISVGIPCSDHFDFVIKNAFLGGNPLDASEESVSDLTKEERYKREYSSGSLGIRYNLPELIHGIISPYIELSAGIQVFEIYTLYNQLDDEYLDGRDNPSMYWFDETTHFLLVNLEGGANILPENLMIFQDSSFQIDLFGGVNVIFGGTTSEISMYRNIHKFWKADDDDETDYLVDMGWKARFIPYFGVGLKIGFDL